MEHSIHKHWEKNSVMEHLPQFEGNVLEVGRGETRCPYCNRLFFKGSLGQGTEIEIQCTRRECKKKIRINKQ
jgi:hypothetical protein